MRLSPPVVRTIIGAVVATALTGTLAQPAFAAPAVEAAAAESRTGTVDTTGDADGHVDVKAAPAPRFDTFATVKGGDKVSVICQTEGPRMSGPKGSSTIWDMIARGGFVPDVKVRTGSKGYVVDTCSTVGKPARANPRTVNGAISWEFARLGQTNWEDLCLAFARAAYGWGDSHWDTAEIGGDYMVGHGLMHTSGIPPRGALVWYHNSEGSGHVMISLGEGLVVGTSVNGRIGVAGYKYHEQYRGWSKPYFPAATR